MGTIFGTKRVAVMEGPIDVLPMFHQLFTTLSSVQVGDKNDRLPNAIFSNGGVCGEQSYSVSSQRL